MKNNKSQQKSVYSEEEARLFAYLMNSSYYYESEDEKYIVINENMLKPIVSQLYNNNKILEAKEALSNFKELSNLDPNETKQVSQRIDFETYIKISELSSEHKKTKTNIIRGLLLSDFESEIEKILENDSIKKEKIDTMKYHIKTLKKKIENDNSDFRCNSLTYYYTLPDKELINLYPAAFKYYLKKCFTEEGISEEDIDTFFNHWEVDMDTCITFIKDWGGYFDVYTQKSEDGGIRLEGQAQGLLISKKILRTKNDINNMVPDSIRELNIIKDALGTLCDDFPSEGFAQGEVSLYILYNILSYDISFNKKNELLLDGVKLDEKFIDRMIKADLPSSDEKEKSIEKMLEEIDKNIDESLKLIDDRIERDVVKKFHRWVLESIFKNEPSQVIAFSLPNDIILLYKSIKSKDKDFPDFLSSEKRLVGIE